LRCLYCQNFPWSQAGTARSESLDADGLAGVFASLARQGCHNWNLVSPTPWLPVIEAALARAKSDGTALPVVYNTSGFERVETLRRFAGLTDVYLTDLRYARDDSAREGSGAAGYVQTARRALAEMARQTGPLRLDADGLAVRGTVCRILILPGRADEAVESLGWLAESAGDAVAVSVMSQYLPAWRAPGRPGWDRRIRREEYERVREAVEAIGFLHGWIQEFGGEAPTELVGYEMKPGGSDGRAETGA
jgi:putative pyruvate formate lyase activating enzyme